MFYISLSLSNLSSPAPYLNKTLQEAFFQLSLESKKRKKTSNPCSKSSILSVTSISKLGVKKPGLIIEYCFPSSVVLFSFSSTYNYKKLSKRLLPAFFIVHVSNACSKCRILSVSNKWHRNKIFWFNYKASFPKMDPCQCPFHNQIQ